MIVYFGTEKLCSFWNEHCKIMLLHGTWIMLTKHTYVCFGELPNDDWYNDSWYSGNSVCDSHQSPLNRQ